MLVLVMAAGRDKPQVFSIKVLPSPFLIVTVEVASTAGGTTVPSKPGGGMISGWPVPSPPTAEHLQREGQSEKGWLPRQPVQMCMRLHPEHSPRW